MPPKTHKKTKPTGVLLLQIDGLSRFQFERAIRSGRMPFLRKALAKKSHELLSFYPGQPSCTPAVQAEIHYGVQCATPAFSFFDSETQQEVRMYDAEWARRIAEESKEQGDGLLEGGSSYANIYTGGAKKAKFCGELNTFAHWSTELSLFRLIRLAVKHPKATFRLSKLLAVEIFIGLYDAFRGITTRGDFAAELSFVPARLAVAIALREAIRSEVLDDISDGLPIVHANFFGYDEAAHRRGPHSRFAHWTLKGLDQTIRKISRAAAEADKRDYKIIIFSDHGQEHTSPYHEVEGRTLAEATEKLLPQDGPFRLSPTSSIAAFMERSQSLFTDTEEPTTNKSDKGTRWVHLQAMGPVAHLYVDQGLTQREKADWSRRYCQEAGIPVALFSNETGSIACRMGEETGGLELLKKRLIARGHAFPDETIEDLRILAESKYAGDLVLLGWHSEGKPLTFADERGAHAGPGAEECRGFVMLPQGLEWSKDWMRPKELRNIALAALGRIKSALPKPAGEIPSSESLRVVSYNVHGGVGTDRRRDVDRLATVINESKADVLCFQEAFENDKDPSHSLHASLQKAWKWKVHYTFLPLHVKRGTQYGLAVASKYPFSVRKSTAFDLDDARISHREPRGAIWIELAPERGKRINIINTHFGLNSLERTLQSQTLIGENWLGSLGKDESLAVCGDFNAGPRGAAYLAFAGKFSDTQLLANKGQAAASFVSWAPLRRIDHIFTSPKLHVPASGVLRSAGFRRASDHLPVYADMEIA